MKYNTVIDTVKVQVDFSTTNEQQQALNTLLQALSTPNVFYIQQQKHDLFQRDYFIYSHQTIIATITTGSFNERSNTIVGYIQKYYISVKFAGLCRYNIKIDGISHYALLKICAFFNNYNIAFKLTELDVCIDAECEFYHVLALCVKKSPKTVYYNPNERQAFTKTTYIEKIPYKKLEKAVIRAYVYDKSYKENLLQHITRFELKLQPKYFHKYGFAIESIDKALNRYYVLYFKNSYDKNRALEAYENRQSFYKREINRLGFDTYRLCPDMIKIKSFLVELLQADDFVVWLNYELPMQNTYSTSKFE